MSQRKQVKLEVTVVTGKFASVALGSIYVSRALRAEREVETPVAEARGYASSVLETLFWRADRFSSGIHIHLGLRRLLATTRYSSTPMSPFSIELY